MFLTNVVKKRNFQLNFGNEEYSTTFGWIMARATVMERGSKPLPLYSKNVLFWLKFAKNSEMFARYISKIE